MIYDSQSYRSYLRKVLDERTSKNPSYSLRAMAQQLGISSSSLSDVIRGVSHFSNHSARKVAERLDFAPQELEYFLLLVEFESARDPDSRAAVSNRMAKLHPKGQQVHDLGLDLFRRVSEWYHSAILEMVDLPGALTPDSIARRLGISVIDASQGMERLERIGLISRDPSGVYRREKNHIMTTAHVPTDAFRRFYRQMLKKIDEALETQPPQERLSAYLTFAFDPTRLKQAEDLLDRFFDDLRQLSDTCSSPTEVYHLGFHLFRLTQRPPRSKP